MCFSVILTIYSDYFPYSINWMVFLMDICVLCEAQSEFLHIIQIKTTLQRINIPATE